MKISIIEPHGFCAGVSAALRAADSALKHSEGKVYCLHEIVHNELVVSELESHGMVFVKALSQVPAGSTVLFSAHGVPPSVREEARQLGLRIIDATCPFVDRVHREVKNYAACDVPVVIIGHANHVEVAGVAGEADKYAVVESVADVVELPFAKGCKLGVVCQTTLGTEETSAIAAEIRRRYPMASFSNASNVCNATRDRQAAVRKFVESALAGGNDKVAVLVLGSSQSSNTRRLAEIAESAGAVAWRTGSFEEFLKIDFSGFGCIGVTSGASTPESFLQKVIKSFPPSA